MKQLLSICIIISSLIISNSLNAQKISEQGFLTASSNFNRQRFNTVVISEVGVGSVITIGLQYLCYKKFPRSRFHFFNDNDEWLNMDKAGHATTAYNIAAFQYNMMRWSGINKISSLWIGAATAFAYMSMIEISDGFSAQWGFSPGDMLANVAGTTFFAAQQDAWGHQKIMMQFSFHKSIYAKYNTGELGNNFLQQMIKDYNGQSYWLSFNLSSFMGKTNFPRWIMANVGYGAKGMTGAVANPYEVDGKLIPAFPRERTLFFGISGAFPANHSIPYPSWINVFKLPSPLIEMNITNSKFAFKPFYY